jgi:hypothetical protein
MVDDDPVGDDVVPWDLVVAARRQHPHPVEAIGVTMPSIV